MPSLPPRVLRDLSDLLTALTPVCDPEPCVFATAPEGQLPACEVLATVVEREGVTAVIRQADADRLGLDYDHVTARITLQVASALDAVGLTAAVSTALAREQISCNVIAGRHHDHLFVDADRAQDAMGILTGLSERACSGQGPDDVADRGLTLSELTERIEYVSAGYGDYYGVERSTDWILLKLTEEVGELVQAHLTASGQGRDRGLDRDQQRAQVAEELADVLGMCLVAAHRAGVDLESAVAAKWLRYEAFHRERGFTRD